MKRTPGKSGQTRNTTIKHCSNHGTISEQYHLTITAADRTARVDPTSDITAATTITKDITPTQWEDLTHIREDLIPAWAAHTQALEDRMVDLEAPTIPIGTSDITTREQWETSNQKTETLEGELKSIMNKVRELESKLQRDGAKIPDRLHKIVAIAMRDVSLYFQLIVDPQWSLQVEQRDPSQLFRSLDMLNTTYSSLHQQFTL